MEAGGTSALNEKGCRGLAPSSASPGISNPPSQVCTPAQTSSSSSETGLRVGRIGVVGRTHMGFRAGYTLVQIPTPPASSCVILGKSLHYSEPTFLFWKLGILLLLLSTDIYQAFTLCHGLKYSHDEIQVSALPVLRGSGRQTAARGLPQGSRTSQEGFGNLGGY